MDQFLRVVAVLLEVSVLGIMMLCLFWGLKLLLDDFGINKKYEKAIVMALSVLWFVIRVFLRHAPVIILSGIQRSMKIERNTDERHVGSRPMIRRTS